MDEHISGLLFSLQAILDVLGEVCDLVNKRPVEIRPVQAEVGIDDGVDAGADKTLRDIERHAKERDWTIALGIVQGLVQPRNCDNRCSSPRKLDPTKEEIKESA